MKRKPIACFVLAGILAMTSACSKTDQAATSKEIQEIKKVGIMTVQNSAVTRFSELSGTLKSYDETSLSFEFGGRITNLLADIGDHVQKGRLLAKLYDEDYALQVQKASAAIQSSEADIRTANAGINSAEARVREIQNGARSQERIQAELNLDKAKDSYRQAQDNFKRIEALYQQGASSQKDYDDAKYRLDTAQKDLSNQEQAYSLTLEGARPEQRESVRAALDQAKARKELAESARQQAKISQSAAQLSLSKTSLASPIDGIILDKWAEENQLVGPGTPVYRIANISSLKVLLPVPDSDIANWNVGKTVDIFLYDESRQGKVAKIYPRTNENTGTVSVEVVIPNQQKDWIPGQIVKAEGKFTGPTGIFVPIESVISSGGNAYLFKNVGGKASKTIVKTGELMDNQIQIVAGLKPGDQIVSQGADRLFDGDRIQGTGGTAK